MAPRPATPKDATPPAPATQKPVAVFRFGSVSAAVFVEHVTKGDRPVALLNVSLRRAYRDAQDVWQHTHSLRADDLLPAALALMKCYEFVEDARGNDDERR